MYISVSSPSTRIAILVHSMNEGGAQKRLVSLANRFAERGHAVDWVAISGKGTVGRLISAAVRQVRLLPATKRPLIRLAAGLRPLTAFLERERPDVLMAGSNLVHVVAAMACAHVADSRRCWCFAPRGIRCATCRGRSPWKRVREYGHRPIERWAYRRADLIIAVSPGKRRGDPDAGRRSGQGRRHPQSDDHRPISANSARNAARSSLVRRGRGRGASR